MKETNQKNKGKCEQKKKKKKKKKKGKKKKKKKKKKKHEFVVCINVIKTLFERERRTKFMAR
jgi:hypothetical protein